MTPVFLVADVEGMKQITSDRHTFGKDLSSYEHVNIFGRSIVTSDGNEWRKHLTVAGPAFSESNNAMVWRETRRLVKEWFATEYDDTPGSSVKVDVLAKMTQATLHVIAAAGFGMRAKWTEFNDPHARGPVLEAVKSKGDSVMLPFHTALEQTLENLFVRMLAPSFMYTLPFRVPVLSDMLAVASAAFSSFEKHMRRVVESVKDGQAVAENAEGLEEEEKASDLLKRLVEANEQEKKGKDKGSLTEGEVFSNVFVSACSKRFQHALTLLLSFRCSYWLATRHPHTPFLSPSSASPSTLTSNTSFAKNHSKFGRLKMTSTSQLTRVTWRSLYGFLLLLTILQSDVLRRHTPSRSSVKSFVASLLLPACKRSRLATPL